MDSRLHIELGMFYSSGASAPTRFHFEIPAGTPRWITHFGIFGAIGI
jgi:hypothetical protein